ncbi:MAG: hypothetical protein M1600_01310, partial [Firmicutes bacterium]|nr:hypothetical protein [Bacillota bacterium]
GYDLREPKLLRYLAIHNQGILEHEGALPTPLGYDARPTVVPAPYPEDHWGTLLKVRDRMCYQLHLTDPFQLFWRVWTEAHQPRSPGLASVREGPDPALAQFRAHTDGAAWWADWEQWPTACQTYEHRALALLEESRTWVESRSELSVDMDSESYGPGEQKLLVRALLVPYQTAVEMWQGEAPAAWQSTLRPLQSTGDTDWTLLAGPGSDHMQVVGIGRREVLERAVPVLEDLYQDAAKSPQVVRLVQDYQRLEQTRQNLRAGLQELNADALERGQCPGCTLWHAATQSESELK